MEEEIKKNVFSDEDNYNIGNKLDDFVILKYLGGSISNHYAKVRSKINNKIYAMKIIQIRILQQQQNVQHQHRKQQLNQNNIVFDKKKLQENQRKVDLNSGNINTEELNNQQNQYYSGCLVRHKCHQDAAIHLLYQSLQNSI